MTTYSHRQGPLIGPAPREIGLGTLVRRLDRDGLWRVREIAGDRVKVDPLDARPNGQWAARSDCVRSGLEG